MPEAFLAPRAFEGLLSRVSSHVHHQMRPLLESVATDFAFERSLARVRSKMICQCSTPSKGLSTFVAFEWSLARVDSDVLRQITLCFECLSTLSCSTFEGSLVHVRSKMPSEVTFVIR